jgi:predicted RNase H-like HicB family nuclease
MDLIVIDNKLCLKITQDGEWFAVSGLNVRGLNTQGKTIEEAVRNARAAARALAKYQRESGRPAAKTRPEAKTARASGSRAARNASLPVGA